MWKNFDKHSAIYHTQSKIENFQFSVTLRTISSLLKVPKFEKTSISEDEDNSADDSDHIENVKIHWQKKILSRYEIEFYKDIENCTTDVQKGYHNWIQREHLTDEGQRNEENIFTYVQDDNFTPKEDLQQQQQQATSVKLRKAKNSSEFDVEPEVMYVFADLNPDTILFTVKWWSSKGILLVYPDFNNYEKNPYFIEIDSDYRHLYSYAVQNISKTVAVDILENLRLPKVLKFDKNLQNYFDMPPKNCTRASILFEIQEGCSFDYDSIHIRYKFELPNRVQLEDGNLVGSTHASSKSSLNGSWRFGYCFQITVICDEDFNFQDSIKVSFEIISRDTWERERNEGFCFLQISINAQRMNLDVLPCYRMDYGFLEKIERFFIGGRRKFKFDEFNSGNEGFLNRYGSKVISTGVLKVGFSVLIQKSPVLPLKSQDRVRRGGMTLTDIMRAYQVARRRLEATLIK